MRESFSSLRLKSLALIRTESSCCYYTDFLFEMQKFRQDIWKNCCTREAAAGTPSNCRTCSLVWAQLDKAVVTWSIMGSSSIWRGGQTLWPSVAPPSQHICSSVKCKSKQNTPAYLKLSISPSLFHEITVSRKWCFPRVNLDSVLAGSINMLLNSTPELSLTQEKHI